MYVCVLCKYFLHFKISIFLIFKIHACVFLDIMTDRKYTGLKPDPTSGVALLCLRPNVSEPPGAVVYLFPFNFKDIFSNISQIF